MHPRRDRPVRRKRWGQHHLRSGALARPLIAALRPSGRCVLEIGPGGGALTRGLLAAGATRVVALEVDPAWAFHLGAERPPDGPGAPGAAGGRLTLVVADALDFAWERLPPSWRVAGNLPYNVGTAILERLLARAPAGLRCGFLLQREVVERLVAAPGGEAYGALSVLVAARARVERLATLRPGSFVPAPRVESAFVGLDVHASTIPPERWEGFEAVVRAAFGQRRKTLRNALGAAYGRERAAAALAAAGLDGGRRAEQLALPQFEALAAALAGPG
jgi:16S rRNA (adenine1518-N6/adenine1519-N6)-dimethyltransferase